VTPHISEGDAIQLKIEQEDSSPGAKIADSSDISTNKRSIKTTIIIEDGGIIVLGGLMQDTVTESEDRVPLLGAIPLLGICSSRARARQKSNLLVFLRPRILRDQATTEAEHLEIQRDPDEERNLHKGKVTLLPGEKQPSIPQVSPNRRTHSAARPAWPPRPGRSRRRRSRALESSGPRAQVAPPSSQPAPRDARGAPLSQPAPTPQPAPRRNRRARTAAAMSAELQEPQQQRKLSFPFAKRHGVLVRGVNDGHADTVCRPGVTPAGALRGAPLRGVPLKLERVTVECSIRSCASPTRRLGRCDADAGGPGRQIPTSPISPTTSPNRRTCSRATTRRRSSA